MEGVCCWFWIWGWWCGYGYVLERRRLSDVQNLCAVGLNVANDAGCEICVWLIMLQYFFLLKHLHVRWLNCIVLSEWYGTSYLMLFLLFCSSITVFYIVYISYGTISIVELMGILCFDWYIFHVHNSQMVLYADDFFRTLFCYWVCWTYILLMIVLNYFRLSITNQICLLYNIFSYFFTWILENIFSFL